MVCALSAPLYRGPAAKRRLHLADPTRVAESDGADLLEGAQIPLPATLPQLLQSTSRRHPVTLRQERPPAPGEVERGKIVTPENLSRPKWLPPKKPEVSSTTLPCLTQTGEGWYLTPLVFACGASKEDARRQGRRAWGGVLGSGGQKRGKTGWTLS